MEVMLARKRSDGVVLLELREAHGAGATLSLCEWDAKQTIDKISAGNGLLHHILVKSQQ